MLLYQRILFAVASCRLVLISQISDRAADPRATTANVDRKLFLFYYDVAACYLIFYLITGCISNFFFPAPTITLSSGAAHGLPALAGLFLLAPAEVKAHAAALTQVADMLGHLGHGRRLTVHAACLPTGHLHTVCPQRGQCCHLGPTMDHCSADSERVNVYHLNPPLTRWRRFDPLWK